MIAMETKTLSDGLLQTGSKLALTGTGSGTLSIADGGAVVGGYFYENTSAASIVVSSLANATYNIVVYVNNTAAAYTVSRSVAGTTVAAYTVRLAVATNEQLSGRTYLQLGTVTVSGASISAITPSYAAYGTTTMVPLQIYTTMASGSATLTTANTTYDVTGYSSPTTTGDGVLLVDNSAGTVTVRRAGLYIVTAYGVFGSGTTGNRLLGIQVNGGFVNSTRAASSGTATHTMTQTAAMLLASGDVVKASCISTLAGQSLSAGSLTVAWA
jgi:hypothetical protein